VNCAEIEYWNRTGDGDRTAHHPSAGHADRTAVRAERRPLTTNLALATPAFSVPYVTTTTRAPCIAYLRRGCGAQNFMNTQNPPMNTPADSSQPPLQRAPLFIVGILASLRY
jgi:hypothetical protein